MRKGYFFHYCDKLKLTEKQIKRLIILIESGLKYFEIYAILKAWVQEENKNEDINFTPTQIKNFLKNLTCYQNKTGCYKYKRKKEE